MNARVEPSSLEAADPPVVADRRPPMQRRDPRWLDYLAYLVLLPLFIAAWLTALGIRPRAEIGTWASFVYVGTRVMVAWWAAHLGARLAARLLRKRSPALWKIMLAGYAIICLPVTILFQYHLDAFYVFFPDLDGRIAHPPAEFTLGYLAFFLQRAAVPFLPVWMAVVHAYRKQFGVDWYAARPNVVAGDAAPAPPVSAGAVPAKPSFLLHSRLPQESRIHTLKAAEHYIEVVADTGKDIIRHRFADAVDELTARALGCQVHRSWWISWEAIARVVPSGRTVELHLHDGRQVPVSLSYKSGFLRQYERRGRNRPA
jgi:hypothetical protein